MATTPRQYLMVIEWTERRPGVIGPVPMSYRADVTDSMNGDAHEEDIIENAGHKLQERAGEAFIEFTGARIERMGTEPM